MYVKYIGCKIRERVSYFGQWTKVSFSSHLQIPSNSKWNSNVAHCEYFELLSKSESRNIERKRTTILRLDRFGTLSMNSDEQKGHQLRSFYEFGSSTHSQTHPIRITYTVINTKRLQFRTPAHQSTPPILKVLEFSIDEDKYKGKISTEVRPWGQQGWNMTLSGVFQLRLKCINYTIQLQPHHSSTVAHLESATNSQKRWKEYYFERGEGDNRRRMVQIRVKIFFFPLFHLIFWLFTICFYPEAATWAVIGFGGENQIFQLFVRSREAKDWINEKIYSKIGSTKEVS